MIDTARGVQLQRLLQLASPTLPVGTFAYSEGLETAVALGWICGMEDVRDWLDGKLVHGFGRLDLPVMYRLYEAWRRQQAVEALRWSRYLMASRETSERRDQERHLGTALAALLSNLGITAADDWRNGRAHARIATFAALFSLAAVHWAIAPDDAATALTWSWLENQVMVAVKLVPLGQTQGQRLLMDIAERVPATLAGARNLRDDGLAGALPGATLMSTGHETLYSRLFRS